MGCRKLAEAVCPLRRDDSGSTVAREHQATGEALLVPARNCWSRVGRITEDTGKSTEDERVADGSVVAVRQGNAC